MTEKLKEISIIIDVWDDVFSDFDPRPLDERALSEDFISELKKRYRETPRGDLLISFYAPRTLKHEDSERMVTQRLKQYFGDRALQKKQELFRTRKKGGGFVLGGIFFLTSITLLAYFNIFPVLMIKILEIVLVPLGWFGIWEGFSKIVNASPGSSQEGILFRKLSKAEYRFNYAKNPGGGVRGNSEQPERPMDEG
jgi:hypothetical protein